MNLDLERIAFGSVVGLTGAAVAAGTGRERNQQINLGEKFDKIAGPPLSSRAWRGVSRSSSNKPVSALRARPPRVRQ
jgi:hypothetical protein